MKIDLDTEYRRRQHPQGGEVRAMASVSGYVMARRPGCVPFVVPLSDWCDWLPFNPNGHSIQAVAPDASVAQAPIGPTFTTKISR